MKSKVLVLVLLVMGLFVVPGVSAGILIGQPDNFYNLGEILTTSLTLKPASDTEDFLEVGIVCSNESIEIHKEFIGLEAGEERIVDVVALLSKSIIGSLSGQCYVATEYGNENVESTDFEITNLINIDFNLDKTKFTAGEELAIDGQILKESGGIVDGFIELSVESLGLYLSKTTSEGSFAFSFTFPEDSKSGEHALKIRVYETDSSGSVSNEGVFEKTISIVHTLTALEIIINEQTVMPGSTLEYMINAYDQAGDDVVEEIILVIYEPGDFIFTEKIIISGSLDFLELEDDYPPGYWKIEALSKDGEFKVRKLFYVEEVTEIHTSLIGDTLIVTNIGNIPYKVALEILIGSSTIVKQINLEIGEVQKFKLFAPEGDYSIRVKDGTREQDFGTVALTGSVIAARDINRGLKLSFSNPLIWVLLGILVLLIISYIVAKVKRKGKPKDIKKPIKESQKRIQKENPNITRDIMYGKKESAGVVALRVKSKTPNAERVVQNALLAAGNYGAKIYVDGSFKIMLLAPSLTKEADNQVQAVKIAKRVEETLRRYGINFGLGVNSGEIISEIKDNQFVFTSMGNIISKAKNLANSSEGEVLVSDEARLRVMSNIRLERVERKGAWRVVRIVR